MVSTPALKTPGIEERTPFRRKRKVPFQGKVDRSIA